MMRKLLVALDGSEKSESILPYLKSLLASMDADVTLARCLRAATPEKLQQAFLSLRRVALKLTELGAVVDVQVLNGDPASELVDLAVRGGYSLILMSSRGRSGLRGLVQGSTAEKVLRRSPVPLFVAPPRRPAPAKPELRRIVVPLDGSHRSGSILEHVIPVAKAMAASLVLVSVVDPRTDGGPVEVLAKTLFREQKAIHRQGIPSELVIRYGDPVEQILSLAAAQGADLLALSTHGRTGLERARYGSVTEALLRVGKVPLLILRTAGKFVSDPLRAPKVRAQRAQARKAETALS